MDCKAWVGSLEWWVMVYKVGKGRKGYWVMVCEAGNGGTGY